MRPEFKVPIGAEKQPPPPPRAGGGLVRVEPQLAIGPGPSYTLGPGGDGLSRGGSQRGHYEAKAHDMPEDAAAQQQ